MFTQKIAFLKAVQPLKICRKYFDSHSMIEIQLFVLARESNNRKNKFKIMLNVISPS